MDPFDEIKQEVQSALQSGTFDKQAIDQDLKDLQQTGIYFAHLFLNPLIPYFQVNVARKDPVYYSHFPHSL